jgi:RNA polymerase-binding transcription factor DksA
MAKKPKPAPAKKPAKPVEKPSAVKKVPPAAQVPPARPAPAAPPARPTPSVPAPKPAPAIPAAKPVAPVPAPKVPVAEVKPSKSDDLKRRILERKTLKPIVFSLDEVREIAKKNEKKVVKPAEVTPGKPATEAGKADTAAKDPSRPSVPNHVNAASLADILGFNPGGSDKVPTEEDDIEKLPEKYRRFFKLLLDLRNHVLESLGQHSEETLKRSAKEDAGDLSGYGQHMADAGTDTFDRDFALSLVSSEQDALSEVEAAIKRIHDGTYGICELTGKPIGKDRLLVVPFTRYSAEAQKELEKTKHRSIQRAGIFADTTTEEGGKIAEEEPEE